MNDTDVDDLRSVDYLVAELADATCPETPSGRANRHGRRYGRSPHPGVCTVVGIGGRTGAMTFETDAKTVVRSAERIHRSGGDSFAGAAS